MLNGPRKVARPSLDANAASSAESNVFGLDFSLDEASVVLLPVPWDVTTSYRPGTAGGWELIRRASLQVDLLDGELAEYGLSRPWEYGIHLASTGADAIAELNRATRELARPIGDRLEEVNGRCERLQEQVYEPR